MVVVTYLFGAIKNHPGLDRGALMPPGISMAILSSPGGSC